MELILAIIVISAVILFGALISIGNERQRQAIDRLQKQVVLWAIQDLRIKAEKLEWEVQAIDPLTWLNEIAAKACGYDLRLQLAELFNNPEVLLCSSANHENQVLFTCFSPHEIRKLSHKRQGRLSRYTSQNPLMCLPRGISFHEFSILNRGVLFEGELSHVWKELTGQRIIARDCLWLYVLRQTTDAEQKPL